MADLPLIPTLGVGSHATPGWLFLFRERMRDGRLGPDDVDEAFEDATRAAIADQVEAGIDIISDGELRRMRFVYEMYDRIDGLDRRPPTRRLGLAGYDRAPKFFALEKLTAPGGLGLVEEYALLARLCPDHPLKIAFPGPLTFARNIDCLPAYGEGKAGLHGLMDDLVAIARAEMGALAAAGAEFIQLDEPGFANPPVGLSIAEGAGIVNRVLDGFEDRAAVHVCFGNNASRPYVRRDFARLFPGLDLLAVSDLAAGIRQSRDGGSRQAGGFARRLPDRGRRDRRQVLPPGDGGGGRRPPAPRAGARCARAGDGDDRLRLLRAAPLAGQGEAPGLGRRRAPRQGRTRRLSPAGHSSSGALLRLAFTLASRKAM